MQPSSLTRLQHMVKSTGDTISLPALKDYLEYMQDAYLFFPIPNLVSPMTEQATLQKRYVADNGILNLFLFQGETKLLENMVAIELNRRFRNTTEETLLYYFNKNVEIDFCVPSAQLAIQVSYNLNDEATYEREVGGLIKFLKAFPGYHGYIITRDYQTPIKADGYTRTAAGRAAKRRKRATQRGGQYYVEEAVGQHGHGTAAGGELTADNGVGVVIFGRHLR